MIFSIIFALIPKFTWINNKFSIALIRDQSFDQDFEKFSQNFWWIRTIIVNFQVFTITITSFEPNILTKKRNSCKLPISKKWPIPPLSVIDGGVEGAQFVCVTCFLFTNGPLRFKCDFMTSNELEMGRGGHRRRNDRKRSSL